MPERSDGSVTSKVGEPAMIDSMDNNPFFVRCSTMDFVPKLSVLPPSQQLLWKELSAVPEEFTLYGGTAVALHLGHRESIDFDFFGTKTFDPKQLYRSVAFLDGAEIRGVDSDTLHCLVDRDGPVKVSFMGYPTLDELKPAEVARDNGLKIASLLDLAATKAAVVQKRAEIKDYIDLDAIFQTGEVDLSLAIAAGAALWQDAFHAESTLKALSYYDDGDLRELDPQIRERLLDAVLAVDLDRLPSIDSPQREGDGWELDR